MIFFNKAVFFLSLFLLFSVHLTEGHYSRLEKNALLFKHLGGFVFVDDLLMTIDGVSTPQKFKNSFFVAPLPTSIYYSYLLKSTMPGFNGQSDYFYDLLYATPKYLFSESSKVKPGYRSKRLTTNLLVYVENKQSIGGESLSNSLGNDGSVIGPLQFLSYPSYLLNNYRLELADPDIVSKNYYTGPGLRFDLPVQPPEWFPAHGMHNLSANVTADKVFVSYTIEGGADPGNHTGNISISEYLSKSGYNTNLQDGLVQGLDQTTYTSMFGNINERFILTSVDQGLGGLSLSVKKNNSKTSFVNDALHFQPKGGPFHIKYNSNVFSENSLINDPASYDKDLLVVDSQGLVGLGVSKPLQALHIKGTLEVELKIGTQPTDVKMYLDGSFGSPISPIFNAENVGSNTDTVTFFSNDTTGNILIDFYFQGQKRLGSQSSSEVVTGSVTLNIGIRLGESQSKFYRHPRLGRVTLNGLPITENVLFNFNNEGGPSHAFSFYYTHALFDLTSGHYSVKIDYPSDIFEHFRVAVATRSLMAASAVSGFNDPSLNHPGVSSPLVPSSSYIPTGTYLTQGKVVFNPSSNLQVGGQIAFDDSSIAFEDLTGRRTNLFVGVEGTTGFREDQVFQESVFRTRFPLMFYQFYRSNYNKSSSVGQIGPNDFRSEVYVSTNSTARYQKFYFGHVAPDTGEPANPLDKSKYFPPFFMASSDGTGLYTATYPTLNIRGGINIGNGAFVIDSETGFMGIGTGEERVRFPLDVRGDIVAKSITGVDKGIYFHQFNLNVNKVLHPNSGSDSNLYNLDGATWKRDLFPVDSGESGNHLENRKFQIYVYAVASVVSPKLDFNIRPTHAPNLVFSNLLNTIPVTEIISNLDTSNLNHYIFYEQDVPTNDVAIRIGYWIPNWIKRKRLVDMNGTSPFSFSNFLFNSGDLQGRNGMNGEGFYDQNQNPIDYYRSHLNPTLAIESDFNQRQFSNPVKANIYNAIINRLQDVVSMGNPQVTFTFKAHTRPEQTAKLYFDHNLTQNALKTEQQVSFFDSFPYTYTLTHTPSPILLKWGQNSMHAGFVFCPAAPRKDDGHGHSVGQLLFDGNQSLYDVWGANGSAPSQQDQETFVREDIISGSDYLLDIYDWNYDRLSMNAVLDGRWEAGPGAPNYGSPHSPLRPDEGQPFTFVGGAEPGYDTYSSVTESMYLYNRFNPKYEMDFLSVATAGWDSVTNIPIGKNVQQHYKDNKNSLTFTVAQGDGPADFSVELAFRGMTQGYALEGDSQFSYAPSVDANSLIDTDTYYNLLKAEPKYWPAVKDSNGDFTLAVTPNSGRANLFFYVLEGLKRLAHVDEQYFRGFSGGVGDTSKLSNLGYFSKYYSPSGYSLPNQGSFLPSYYGVTHHSVVSYCKSAMGTELTQSFYPFVSDERRFGSSIPNTRFGRYRQWAAPASSWNEFIGDNDEQNLNHLIDYQSIKTSENYIYTSYGKRLLYLYQRLLVGWFIYNDGSTLNNENDSLGTNLSAVFNTKPGPDSYRFEPNLKKKREILSWVQGRDLEAGFYDISGAYYIYQSRWHSHHPYAYMVKQPALDSMRIQNLSTQPVGIVSAARTDKETYTVGSFLGNSEDYVGELYGKRLVTPVLYDGDYPLPPTVDDITYGVSWFYAVNSCKLGIAYLTTHYINTLKGENPHAQYDLQYAKSSDPDEFDSIQGQYRGQWDWDDQNRVAIDKDTKLKALRNPSTLENELKATISNPWADSSALGSDIATEDTYIYHKEYPLLMPIKNQIDNADSTISAAADKFLNDFILQETDTIRITTTNLHDLLVAAGENPNDTNYLFSKAQLHQMMRPLFAGVPGVRKKVFDYIMYDLVFGQGVEANEHYGVSILMLALPLPDHKEN